MRLAIMGLKGHQTVVLTGARQLGDVDLVAVSDDDPRALDQFRKEEPLARQAQTYADWKHLLDHTMVDVVCLCDENGIRAEQLLALCARNVAIVTEKPLTTNLEDLERVRQAHARSKSRLSMLLTMRHEPQYPAMRQMVADGLIGEVCQVSVQKSYQLHTRPEWFKQRARLGGTIPYIGIHAVDLARWITGLEFTHVAAFHGQIGRPEMKETENHASLLLRMSNGASATIRLDYLRPQTAPSHGDDRIRIVGGKGIIEGAYPHHGIQIVTAKEKPRLVKPGPTDNLFVDFVKAWRADRSPRITAADAFRVTEIVLKARAAAEQGNMVELTPAKST